MQRRHAHQALAAVALGILACSSTANLPFLAPSPTPPPILPSPTATYVVAPTLPPLPAPTATAVPTAAPPALVPDFAHIVTIVFENKEFGNVIKNPNMPYFNSLAKVVHAAYAALCRRAPQPAELPRPDRRRHIRRHLRLHEVHLQCDHAAGSHRGQRPHVESLPGGYAVPVLRRRRVRQLCHEAQSIRLLRAHPVGSSPLPSQRGARSRSCTRTWRAVRCQTTPSSRRTSATMPMIAASELRTPG